MSFFALPTTSDEWARMYRVAQIFAKPKFRSIGLSWSWVCLTQLLPLARFLTSSGVYVPRTLTALFHAVRRS
jgi:hypothetical protein